MTPVSPRDCTRRQMLRQCPAPFGGAVFPDDYRIRLIFLNETAAHCINSIPILAEAPALDIRFGV